MSEMSILLDDSEDEDFILSLESDNSDLASVDIPDSTATAIFWPVV